MRKFRLRAVRNNVTGQHLVKGRGGIDTTSSSSRAHALNSLMPHSLPRCSGCLPALSPPRPALLLLADVSSTLLLLTSTLPAFQATRCSVDSLPLWAPSHHSSRDGSHGSLITHPSIHSHPSFMESWNVRARRGLRDYLAQWFLNKNTYFKEKRLWKF